MNHQILRTLHIAVNTLKEELVGVSIIENVVEAVLADDKQRQMEALANRIDCEAERTRDHMLRGLDRTPITGKSAKSRPIIRSKQLNRTFGQAPSVDTVPTECLECGHSDCVCGKQLFR